jgi:ribose-phosphate pyrophosphokinase
MKIIAGNSNLPLAQAISEYLDIPLCKASIKRFSDHEMFAEILENVRGEDVFVVQSTSFPANDNLMELLITIDALRRGSARRITAVIPYFGYARQDRKTGGRTPISAKLVANLITAAGVDRVLTMELHAGQIQGFFDIPLDNLIIAPIFVPEIEKRFKDEDLVIVSPDVGGVVRARAMAKRLGADLAIIDKRREKAGVSEVMHVIGDVKDKVCIMVDDIVDSGGTLCNAATGLKAKGAKEVYAFVVHGVLSGAAVDRIADSDLECVVTANTIAATEGVQNCKKVEQLSVAKLLGEGIKRIAEERSISELFRYD